MQIVPFDPEVHLTDLQSLVNWHLAAVVPSWGLPARYIADRLRRNPDEYVVDPWVAQRCTLCAVAGGCVVAASHLLLYGEGAEVGDDYKGIGCVDWFLVLPDRIAEGTELLHESRHMLAEWGARRQYGWGMGLPVPVLYGVPDPWPHVGAALHSAGFEPEPQAIEAVWAGRLPDAVQPETAPLSAMTLTRRVERLGTRLVAALDGVEVGYCVLRANLSQGGRIPALGGWATVRDFVVEEPWRSRGIGRWLLAHSVAWMRLAGCDQVVFMVAVDEDGERAGRLYARLGWLPLARQRTSWIAAD